MNRLRFVSFAVVVTLSAPRIAFAADDVRTCVDAVEAAQIARRDGKLRRAREELLVCSRDVCPGPVRKDCITWSAEVEASVPSIVLAARLRDGRDLHRGRVLLDGEPLADPLGGRAFVVDPGVHRVRFELEGTRAAEIEAVAREGEKNHLVAVTLDEDVVAPERSRAVEASRRIPTSVFVLGGVGAVGVAGFAYFGTMGRSELGDLRDRCVHTCADSDVDAARRKLLVGDLFLASGIVVLGIATYLYFTR